ncbi:MAG: hypothetical protein K0Q90_3428 [Paenibacillaceae bacterium]|jgi:two-component system response regulator YesN|nr:hypothetical protein [Paenibacillaceae bacterium]
MYKVLLVDDELLDLEGLARFMDWGSMDMEVCASAASGFEALELLDNHTVDIMVSDIKMPIMSGMELARRALEKQPLLKIIFVSGYEDFHYARQAIALNAFGYVLKPVDNAELHKALADVKSELDEERKRSHLETYFSESQSHLRQELLLNLLEGTAGEDNVLPLLESIGVPWQSSRFFTAVLEPDDLSWKLNGFDEPVKLDVKAKLAAEVEIFCREEAIESCRLDSLRHALILEEDYKEDCLHRLLQRIGNATPVTATIGIGPLVSDLSLLHISSAGAKDALSRKLFLGKGRLIRHTDGKSQMSDNVRNLDHILETLCTAISAYELLKVDDCIEELFVLAGTMDTKLAVYQLFLHIVSRLDAYLHTLNEDFYGMLGLEMRNLNILYHFETLADMKSWLRRRMFELSELLHRKRQGKKRKLVEEIEAYVESHLEGGLMLRDAAHHFAFSPNHFGQIFFEETGIYFSDYVTTRRLERVKQLLTDPKLKVYEAAQRVGYKNLSHFSKQFKDYFGLSPGDFRRQL